MNFKIIYTMLLFIVCLQFTTAQIVFKEDFGTSTVRMPSIFVPQAGNDLGLEPSQYTCTPYYRAALELYTNENRPNCNGTNLSEYNTWLRNISDGYYTVIDPKSLETSLGSTGNWWKLVDDHTPNDTNGAAMIVNAGKIKNQYYRRAVNLKRNTAYKLSYYMMSISKVSSSTVIPTTKVEVQNLRSEESLSDHIGFGTSNILKVTAHNVWQEKSFVFKTPDDETCSTNIAIALRNDLQEDEGNDFYIDDIVLEEINDNNVPVIDCSREVPNTDDLVFTDDDIFPLEVAEYNIIANDKINNTQEVILSGVNKNALISKVGNWPAGITINTETGMLVITDTSVIPTEPLQYQVCNLMGVCSIATITLTTNSSSSATSEYFSLESEVQNICFTGNAHNKTVRYTLKNITNQPITIVGESSVSTAGKKLKFNSNNIDRYSIRLISGQLELTGAIGYVKAKTFAPGETIVFEMNYNYTNLTQEVTGILELRHGVSTPSGPMNSTFESLSVTNKISKIPTKPTDISRELNQAGTFTIYQAAGLTAATSKYKFYNESGREIAHDTPVNMNMVGELVFTYTLLSASGCESEPGIIRLTKSNIELPEPGQISFDETDLVEVLNLCAIDGNIASIFNKTEGSGTYVTDPGFRYGLKYSWMVSYDEGIRWYEFQDSDGNQDGETSNGRKEIELKDIKNSVWIRRKAHERPTSSRVNNYSFSNILKVNIQKNDIAIAGGNFHSQPLYLIEEEGGVLNQELNKFVFPSITTEYNSTVVITDERGNTYQPGSVFTYRTEGTYNFTIKATTTGSESDDVKVGCETYASLTLSVYDLSKCKVVTDKIIATAIPPNWGTTLAGMVVNKENAYDNDLSTHSTVSIALGLLGLGTTWQNLYFDHMVPAGTPVSIKLGQEYSGLQLAGGITVVGLDERGNGIGAIQSVGEGALLDLLAGDNVFVHTFVPKNSSGVPQSYKGVRVILGSLAAVANNAVIYGAYYEKERVLGENDSAVQSPIFIEGAKFPVELTQVNQLRNFIPNTPERIEVFRPENIVSDSGNNILSRKLQLNQFVDDISWGVQDIGLGLASSLSSVVYPYLAVDDNPFTYAIFNKTVAAINKQVLDIRLRNEARPGDELELIMTSEGINVLSLDLGADFKVQRYYNDEKVGPVVSSNEFKIVNLNLFLFKDPVPRFRVNATDKPFNRVEISYMSGVQANLGNYTYLHDVSVIPQSVFTDEINLNDEIQLCAADFIKISKPSVCTEFEMSFVIGEKQVRQITEINEDGVLTTRNVDRFVEVENQNLVDQILTRVHETDKEAYYDVKRLYSVEEGKVLLLKIQTIQNKVNYGAPQYIHIKLENCLQSIVNPTINLDSSIEEKNDVFK